ncbi:MAG TPA: glycosyltransferase, partial [Deinococcales bacterium]|nr:glycosyltransferase [Deinococcales bacterium]
MRILIAHNLYQVPGGEDVVADMEAAALADSGHVVERYTVDNDEIEGLGAAGKARLAVETVWNERRRREFRRLLENLRPHVVHAHNTFPLLSPSVYAACRDARVPVVQTLHNYRLLCPVSSFYRDGHVCEDCLGKLVPYPGVAHACYRDSRA